MEDREYLIKTDGYKIYMELPYIDLISKQDVILDGCQLRTLRNSLIIWINRINKILEEEK